MNKEIRSEQNFSSITQKYLDKDLTVKDLLRLEIRPSQIQSVLVDLSQNLADRKNIQELLQNYKSNRFSEPSPLPQRESMYLSDLIYKQIPSSYKDIELSPVVPLGLNTALTKVSQKSILSTIRNLEVLADPTTMLALETASERRRQVKGSPSSEFIMDFCTSVRCTRCQLFPKSSGFLPHFRVFAMSSGGISLNGRMDSKIIEHVDVLLSFLKSIQESDHGYSVNNISVEFSDINITESLIKKMNLDRKELGRHSQDSSFNFFKTYDIDLPDLISLPTELDKEKVNKYRIWKYTDSLQAILDKIDPIKNKYPQVAFKFNLSRIAGIGYYNGPCFKINASNSRNELFPLADGGYSSWLANLMSNKRAQFFSSGFGLELFGNLYKS